jgi:hypothetical protein
VAQYLLKIPANWRAEYEQMREWFSGTAMLNMSLKLLALKVQIWQSVRTPLGALICDVAWYFQSLCCQSEVFVGNPPASPLPASKRLRREGSTSAGFMATRR